MTACPTPDTIVWPDNNGLDAQAAILRDAEDYRSRTFEFQRERKLDFRKARIHRSKAPLKANEHLRIVGG